MNQLVQFQDLQQASYKEVWDYQESLLQQKVAIKQQAREANINPKETSTTHHLLFVEHPPVYTLGKNGNENNVLLTPTELQEKNIEYFHINRGGDITFHGPGQIVGYPIFDLDKFSTDLGWYLRSLEEVIIKTLAYRASDLCTDIDKQ